VEQSLPKSGPQEGGRSEYDYYIYYIYYIYRTEAVGGEVSPIEVTMQFPRPHDTFQTKPIGWTIYPPGGESLLVPPGKDVELEDYCSEHGGKKFKSPEACVEFWQNLHPGYWSPKEQ
jgi:hypothetical protein